MFSPSPDPRGSGFQGDAWRHAVYRQFGTVEVIQRKFSLDHLTSLVSSIVLG